MKLSGPLREMTVEEKVDYLWHEFHRLKLMMEVWAKGIEDLLGVHGEEKSVVGSSGGH